MEWRKIKMHKKGSKVIISNSSTPDRIINLRATDDQTPKSNVSLRANPGGATPILTKPL